MKKNTTDEKIIEEILEITESIPDPYVRTITSARLGYLLKKDNPHASLKVFKFAIASLDEINDPVLIIRAMITTARYLRMAGVKDLSENMLHRAYEGTLLLRGKIRDRLLVDVIREVLNSERKHDAILYATDIEDEILRNKILLEILKQLVQAGDVQKAKKVIGLLTKEPEKSQAAFEVIKGHLEREEFASVLSLLPSVENEYWLEMALEETAKKLIESNVPIGTYEKFVEAAKELSERLGRDLLKAFLTGLVEEGDIKTAAKILNSSVNRATVAAYLSKLLIDKPRELKIFVQSLQLEPGELDTLAKAILNILLERKPKLEYQEVVEFFGKRTENEGVLVKVTTYLAKIGEFESAEGFAEIIDDPYLRSLAFGAIALERLRRKNIDMAIEAVKKVPDEEWGSWLMGEILIKIVEGSIGEHPERELEEKAELYKKRKR